MSTASRLRDRPVVRGHPQPVRLRICGMSRGLIRERTENGIDSAAAVQRVCTGRAIRPRDPGLRACCGKHHGHVRHEARRRCMRERKHGLIHSLEWSCM